ncbi:MAG: hypothetical protein ACE5JQ_08260 [Candidatus Methylomirabilales bacterium]
MRPHVFCLTCGKVKNLHGPRARRLGFYLSGLAALRGYLGRSPEHGKMTQSQGRLITKSLEELREFEDSYDLGVDIQGRIYLEAVKRVRPDLEEELVLRLLPKVRRKTRKSLFGVTAGASAG